jgi:tetratricopeptide (TPR) repeat protein
MSAPGRRRRIALALISLLCAALLFRGNVALALVARGDDLLGSGDLDGAARSYGRAIFFDRGAIVAADRLAFALWLRRRPGDARRGFDVASHALEYAPHNVVLLADRGFAAQRLGRWRDAESSFAAAAAIGHDPRYAHLAAHMARRAGDRAAERRHLRAALAIDRAYAPARALLARLHQ